MNPILDYDPTTDSLYIKIRAGESVGNRIIGDDVVLDIGIDGEPVGYDIQHASQNAEAIADALEACASSWQPKVGRVIFDDLEEPDEAIDDCGSRKPKIG